MGIHVVYRPRFLEFYVIAICFRIILDEGNTEQPLNLIISLPCGVLLSFRYDIEGDHTFLLP